MASMPPIRGVPKASKKPKDEAHDKGILGDEVAEEPEKTGLPASDGEMLEKD